MVEREREILGMVESKERKGREVVVRKKENERERRIVIKAIFNFLYPYISLSYILLQL